MKSVAIVGANGFVGQALCKASKNYDVKVTKVTRKNYGYYKNFNYDILINTAMPSRRFWSSNNPTDDVMETITKTANLFYEWQYKKFVQVSSISAENQLDIPYGAHKRAAEVIVSSDEDALIVRLGALFGDGLSKSALFDLLSDNHMYVDINSEYNYIDISFVSNWIFKNIERSGIINLGAKDTISLLEISNFINAEPSYEGKLEKVNFKEINEIMPSSREVLKYALTFKGMI